ncbi:MAG: hypothetical protein PWP08_1213 [Methanofollis sp.]|nr:hypothetical protein [Methanofollis sp.]
MANTQCAGPVEKFADMDGVAGIADGPDDELRLDPLSPFGEEGQNRPTDALFPKRGVV